ncbi:MAG: VanW family protein [Clostridia bacterium]|nr:VanW family protein [Clostridia bacterium]
MEYDTGYEPRQKKTTQGHTARVVLITLLVVALIMGGVLLTLKILNDKEEAARQAIIHSDLFHPGIEVGGVDVSNMTYANAVTALQAKQDEALADMRFLFTCNGSNYTADSTYFLVSSDADEQLKAAFTLGREGTLEQLQSELADIAANGRSFDVTYTIDPDGAKFEALIQTISQKIDKDPTEATYTVKQLPIDPDTGGIACFNIGLPSEEAIKEGATPVTDVRDLRFDFIEGENGWGVKHDELYDTVVARTKAREWGTIEVPLGEIPPVVTIETLKQSLVLRSESITKYAGSSNRVFNIKKAVGSLYGLVLQPGESFSHNTALGDRTEEGGWKLAPAVIGGGANHEDQPGGGVCQTSTTLYQAVLMSDLQVDARKGHSTMSSYAEGGLDCTIADSTTGNIDFQFTNNTNAPIYIFMWLETKSKRCHAEIYGEPFADDFDHIQLYSELIETIPPTADVYTQNPQLFAPYWQQRNSAKEGYSFDAYKLYMMGDTEVRRVKIDNTVYKMHPARFYVWPTWAGEALDPLYQLPYQYTD